MRILSLTHFNYSVFTSSFTFSHIFHPFKTYYNQGQSRTRRHNDPNPDRQNHGRENRIDIKTDPTDDYHRESSSGRNQNQFNPGRIREKWSDEADQGHHGQNYGRNDNNRGRRFRGRGYYRGGRGHYHHGRRRGNNGYRDGQNHGCNNSSEQDLH